MSKNATELKIEMVAATAGINISYSVNSSNGTGFSLPMNYVVLNAVAAVLNILLIIIPSLMLNSFIINFYCKTRSHINSSITSINLNYCIAALIRNVSIGIMKRIITPLSANYGSCIGQWADAAITISFGVLSSLLITLLTVVQCTIIVGGAKRVSLKRVAFSLLVIWIYSSMWGIFSYVIFAVDGHSYFACELAGVNEASNVSWAVHSITFAISSFVLIEAPLPVIIIISTTTSCIKYSKSRMKSKDSESLTRKMILLPFLTTLISIIPFTAYKYFVIALNSLLSFEERKQSPAIGTRLFGSILFEFVAGPLFAIFLIYLNVPLHTAFKKFVKRKNQVHPEAGHSH